MKINLFEIFIFIVFSSFLSILLYNIAFLFIKRNDDVEKLTAYECGFNPYDDARKVFDIRFYLIALMFIVFDIESIFIFPWVMSFDVLTLCGFWSMIEFLSELAVGYGYIWFIGALDWS